jgi:hypothetical protein
MRHSQTQRLTLTAAICVAVTVFLVTPLKSAQPEPEKEEPYYSQLTRAVVKLEQQQSICVPGLKTAIQKTQPIGSAFFVRDSFNGEMRFFIVTARHNLNRPGDLFVRVQTGPGSEEHALLLLPASHWVFHPEPTRRGYLPVDVAVMRIAAQPFIKTFLNCSTDGKNGECGHNYKTKEPLVNQIVKSPSVLRRAIFLGFPGGTETAVDSPEPLARGGVVAYTAHNPKLRIDNRPLTSDSVYLLDATSLRGNSGGPVLKEILPLSSTVELWGLVTASNHLGRYTIVTRPERIAETIAHARATAMINDGWANRLPVLPVGCVTESEEAPQASF